MTRTILLAIGLLVALNLFGQDTCSISKLTQQDRALLKQFLVDFKAAVVERNKTKLASLCQFSFACDYCVLDSTNQTYKPYVNVSRKEFEKSQYQIFFEERLRRAVIKYQSLEDFIVTTYYDSTTKRCRYSFMYVVREENQQHPGMQRFFDVQKVKGKFKIISTWTVP